MSRVNDAMRQAGRDDGRNDLPDESVFEQAEPHLEPVVEPPDDEPPASVQTEPAMRGELVRQVTPLPPVPVARVAVRDEVRDEMRVQDVLRTLYRHKWLIAAIVLLSAGLAVAYNRQAVRIYEARAQVLIDPTSQQVVPMRSPGEDTGRFDYFVTQLEVLRSRGLAKKTLEHLKVLSDNVDTQRGQISELVGGLSVAPQKTELGESRIVNISVRSTSAEKAAMLANAHAETYVTQNLANLQRGSSDASEFIDEKLAELRRAVSQNESALQSYREREGAISLGEPGQNVTAQAFMQLNQAVTTAVTERAELESAYRQLVALEQNHKEDTFPEIAANGAIMKYKDELAALKRQKDVLLETLVPNNPEVQNVDAQIATAQLRLSTETAKIVDSIKNKFYAAQAKEKQLRGDLARQQDEVSALNRKSIQYTALQREASSAQQMLENLMGRLKETELSAQLPTNNIRFHERAEVPGDPISPKESMNIAIAVLLGLFAATGLVFTLESLNPKVADGGDVVNMFGLPLLGSAPKVNLDNGVAALSTLAPSFQEAIRGIRTQIFLTTPNTGGRTLAVTSARQGEGKTVMSSSLAVSMAMAGRRVLLIDADLRRSGISEVFGVSRSPGLSNVLAGEVKPSAALLETQTNGLFLLPAGNENANPGDLLDSERLTQLIGGLRRVFDVVIIDCPPVLAVADATIVASVASAAVMVVRAGSTKQIVGRALEHLNSSQTQVIGVVLNRAKATSMKGYHYSPSYASTH